MRVCVFNPNNDDATLILKEAHFREANREAQREHVRKETGLHFVWFEDEDPPQEFLDHLQEGTARAKETGYWPDGEPYTEDDNECQSP